jgi:hypothetical protein
MANGTVRKDKPLASIDHVEKFLAHKVDVVARALVGAPSSSYVELVQGPSGGGLVGWGPC